MQKVSKASVDYRHSQGKRDCGNCGMFNWQTAKCDLVKGFISPNDVCDKWVNKEKRKP